MGPLLLPSFPWQRALLIAFGALRITTIASQLPPISPTDEKSMFSRSCCFRFLRSSCLARSARVILGPAPGGRSCLGARIARIHPNAHPLAASLSLLLLTPPIYFSSSSLLSQSSLEFLELDPILFRVSSPFILPIGPFLLHSNTCLPAAFHPICLRRRPPARRPSPRLRRERRVCILARRKHPYVPVAWTDWHRRPQRAQARSFGIHVLRQRKP